MLAHIGEGLLIGGGIAVVILVVVVVIAIAGWMNSGSH